MPRVCFLFASEVWACNCGLKPFHIEHKNIIFAKKSFVEKGCRKILGKNKSGAVTKKLLLTKYNIS